MTRTLVLAALLLAPLAARAQIDAETDKPYDFQVVLRCGAHNALGKRFRDELRSNLSGMLTNALGSMANVTVIDQREIPVDKWQPLWLEVEGKGLGALDSARELDGAKTHFVRINYVDGQYEVEARQLDGLTGAASPWRHEQTADRAFVARLAGRLIAEDFGLIATIAGKGGSTGDTGEVPVGLKFKGAGLVGGQLGRWVRKGDVFALYRITPGRGGAKDRGFRETDGSVVRITDDISKSGDAMAKLYFRDVASPLTKAVGNQGFRCVRLGTVSGPMRLRLMREDGQPHTALQVRVSSQGFEGHAGDDEILTADRGGLFTSRRNYDHVAFARVVTSATLQIARIPVPIEEGREYTTEVKLDAKRIQTGDLAAQRADLNRLYTETAAVLTEGRTQVNKLVNQQKNTEALKRARSVRDALVNSLRRLGGDKEELRKKLTPSGLDLAFADDMEKKLDDQKDRLNRQIGQLIELEQLFNAPDKVQRRIDVQQAITKASGQIDSYDFDGALKTLNDLLAKYPDEANVKKQRDELAAKWELHGDEHARSRQWVYETWAAVKTYADVEKHFADAPKRRDILVNVKDKLTLLKLMDVNVSVIAKIFGEENKAAGDDKERKDKVQKLFADFEKFHKDVTAASSAKD